MWDKEEKIKQERKLEAGKQEDKKIRKGEERRQNPKRERIN
jgi:hypothetical protein